MCRTFHRVPHLSSARACAFYAKRTDVLVDNKFTHITVACFVKGQSVCDVYFVCTSEWANWHNANATEVYHHNQYASY